MDFIKYDSTTCGVELGGAKDSAEYFDLMQLEFPFVGNILHNNKEYKLEVEVCGCSKGTIKIDEFGNLLPIECEDSQTILTLDKELYLRAIELELKTGNSYIDWVIKAFLIVNIYHKEDFVFLVKDSFSSIQEILKLNITDVFKKTEHICN